MNTEPSPSILERLELQARERGLLLRLQVGRPLGLWSLRLVVACPGPNGTAQLLGEMKGWGYGTSNGLQLDTMRVVPQSPAGVGDLVCAAGDITLNEGREAVELMVANTGDRPIQVGSHYHFAETNPALEFDRAAAHGQRLNIAAGTAVRFEPGQKRAVSLIKIAGGRRVFGFNGKIMGDL